MKNRVLLMLCFVSFQSICLPGLNFLRSRSVSKKRTDTFCKFVRPLKTKEFWLNRAKYALVGVAGTLAIITLSLPISVYIVNRREQAQLDEIDNRIRQLHPRANARYLNEMAQRALQAFRDDINGLNNGRNWQSVDGRVQFVGSRDSQNSCFIENI